jgi:hypothetical protein
MNSINGYVTAAIIAMAMCGPAFASTEAASKFDNAVAPREVAFQTTAQIVMPGGPETANPPAPDAQPVISGQPAPLQDKDAVRNAMLDALDERDACLKQAYALPEYAVIKDKFPSQGNETVAPLTDSTVPTDAEVSALKVVSSRLQACWIVTANKSNKLLPGTDLIFSNLNSEWSDLNAALIAKKMPWGEMLLKRKSAFDVFVKGMAVELARVGLD